MADLFRKRRNISRQKERIRLSSHSVATHSSNLELEQGEDGESSPKSKIVDAGVGLSFVDDEDSVFQVKNAENVKDFRGKTSTYSYPSLGSLRTIDLSRGKFGEYTSERLESLKQNTNVLFDTGILDKKVCEGDDQDVDVVFCVNEEEEEEEQEEEKEREEEEKELEKENVYKEFPQKKKKKKNKRIQQNKYLDEEGEMEEEVIKRWEMETIRKALRPKQMKIIESLEMERRSEIEKKNPYPFLDIFGRDIRPLMINDVQVEIDKIKEREIENWKYYEEKRIRLEKESQLITDKLNSIDAEIEESVSHAAFLRDMKKYISCLLDCLAEKGPLIDSLLKRALDLEKTFLTRSKGWYVQKWRDQFPIEIEEKEEKEFGMKLWTKKMANFRNSSEKIDDVNIVLLSIFEEFSVVMEEQEEEEKNFAYDPNINDCFDQNIWNESIRGDINGIFADVDAEYCSLDIITMKFGLLRKDFPEKYAQAYISLSLPKLFSPFVILEYIKNWIPMCSSISMGVSFLDTQEWLNCLMKYDNNIVPNLVSRVALPYISVISRYFWWPLSYKLNMRLVALVSDILPYFQDVDVDMDERENGKNGGDESRSNLCALLDLILVQLSEAVEFFVSMSANTYLSYRSSIFSIVLLANLSAWSNVLAENKLKSLIVVTTNSFFEKIEKLLLYDVSFDFMTVLDLFEILLGCSPILATMPTLFPISNLRGRLHSCKNDQERNRINHFLKMIRAV